LKNDGVVYNLRDVDPKFDAMVKRTPNKQIDFKKVKFQIKDLEKVKDYRIEANKAIDKKYLTDAWAD